MMKRIGTKVLLMLIVLSSIFVATAMVSNSAVSQTMKGMINIHDNYTQLERKEMEIVRAVEGCKFSCNMIVWYQNM